MSAAAPPKPPPKPPGKPATNGNGASTAPSGGHRFTTSSGVLAQRPQRIIIYGPGGIGKTSLLSLLSRIGMRVKVLDLDEGSGDIDIARIDPGGPWTWASLCEALADQSLWSGVDAVAIDSVTKAEELAISHVLSTIKTSEGYVAKSIEDYGWGKGYTHAYEAFLPLLGMLDMHVRAGRSVILVCHECTANVPNPAGPDWIRYEPRLQSPPSGKNSIRLRVKEWCDHMLFIGYDALVSKDGKAKGSGTRTIYPVELPMHMAKSRSLRDPIQYIEGDPAIWEQIFNKQRQE